MPRQRRSPFSGEIYKEWDQLVLSEGEKLPLEVRSSRARALLAKCLKDGRWIVAAPDACLAASVNVGIALTEARHNEAKEICRLFLSHPDPIDEVERAHFTVREGIAGILMGEVEPAVEMLSRHLRENDLDRSFRLDLRNVLRIALDELGLDRPCNPLVRDLVAQVVSMFRGKKRLARKATITATNKELLEVLDGTYPQRSAG